MSNGAQGDSVTLPYQEATVPQLRDVWLLTLEQFLAAAEAIPASEWQTPSPCPGWTVGDVVAHVLSLEAELHGAPLPDHEPDWAALPHANDPVSRYTETGVDFYRDKGRDVVLAELREMLEWRRADLATLPEDPDELTTSIGGWQLPRHRMIRVRVLDTWTHEQDIRTAAGLPGDLDTPGAWVTAGQFLASLGYVWARSVQAPVGSTLRLRVTGPGVEFSRTVVVNDEGKGRFTDDSGEPTVSIRLSWPLYASLSAGREGAQPAARNGGALVTGDADLGHKALAAFAVTP